MGQRQVRGRDNPLRQVSPGWGSYYAGLYGLWMRLPLWLRRVLALLFVVAAAVHAALGGQ